MSLRRTIQTILPLLRRVAPSTPVLLRPIPISSSRFLSTSSILHATPTSPSSSTIDPREVAAQESLSLGTAALESSDLPSAAQHYLQSISIKPTAIAYYNLGVVRYQSSDLKGAIENFLKSLELGEENDSGGRGGVGKKEQKEEEERSYPPTARMMVKADTLTNLGAAYILSEPPRPDLALA
jgi:tetratricopeptide (TPR) repeat protein